MKSFRLVALSAALTLGSFGTIFYNASCSKDECKDVVCSNGGTCSGGTCKCPSGVTGDNCQTIYRNGYAFTYKGNGTDNLGGTYTGSKLYFTYGNDTTDYTKMSLRWEVASGATVVTLPIVLSNFSSTGSIFNVTSTVVDTFTYTGTGSVNGSIATLTLTESTPNAPAVIYTFSNFVKQ